MTYIQNSGHTNYYQEDIITVILKTVLPKGARFVMTCYDLGWIKLKLKLELPSHKTSCDHVHIRSRENHLGYMYVQ